MLNNASPGGRNDNTERDAENGGPASPVLAPENSEFDIAPSLSDDITALIDDGKAYVEAELAFQKSRAGFAGQEAKAGVGYALAMFGVLHLALIGAVVGLIIALGPLVGAFAAAGIVVGVLLLATALFAWLAVRRFGKIGRAFDEGKSDKDAGDPA